MTPEEKQEKLRKLKSLAERGIDGERENATAMLTRLMAQWGVSLDDLGGEDTLRNRIIHYCDQMEADLAYYVYKSVVSDCSICTDHNTTDDGDIWTISVWLTDYDYASARALHEIMWSAMEITRNKMTTRHKRERDDITENLKALRKKTKHWEEKRKKINSTQRREKNWLLTGFIVRNRLDEWVRCVEGGTGGKISDAEYKAYCMAYKESVAADSTLRFGAQALPAPSDL